MTDKNIPEAKQPPNIESSYETEIFRKSIHLCSLSIPIVYYFVTKSFALSVLIPLTLAFIVVDIGRYYIHSVREWFYKLFGWLLRQHESDHQKKRLNGASYVLISATICILIFPKIIVITSFAILIISDLTAALVGRRFGKHRFFKKTVEGSLGFLLSAIIVVAVAPKYQYHAGEYLIGIIAACIGTVVEALPIELDDNLSVPLSVSIVLLILYHYFYPSLNL